MRVIAASLGLWLRERSPHFKLAIVVVSDWLMATVMLLLAYALRLSEIALPPAEKFTSYFPAPTLSVLSAFGFGVYKIVARNYSHVAERKIVLSQTVAVAAWVIWLFILGTAGFARSVIFIYGVLAISGMILLRRSASYFFNIDAGRTRRAEAVPVIVYGATREGMTLVDDMRRKGGLRPVAFIDTDYTLMDRTVQGLRVYSPENLSAVLVHHSPREVIIAKPGLTRTHRRTLVNGFMDQGLTVRIAPDIGEIAGGHVTVGDLRPINVEDLLGRDPVPPDEKLMSNAISGLCVMVTGAGGSIGSELVRQALPYGPRKLVLVEHSEFSLFEIHRQIGSRLNRTGQVTEIIPVLADVKDKAALLFAMRENGVDVVYHAAAYKHVHMVQQNPIAGILNNVSGTQTAAEAAIEAGVARFVLISTDKAVRPTSVMGASKRVAEMVVQAFASQPGQRTVFSMVRFGNVLGSTGSVVPLFREQIANGGPVTVTHPEITRYFMMISEAAQLVIQASAMATGGDVFVLDMGEPVKIVKLAETMIELAGYSVKDASNPQGDIEIVFSGLKDGEKLYEELEIGENLSPTRNARIMRAEEGYSETGPLLDEMKQLATGNDRRLATHKILDFVNSREHVATKSTDNQRH